MSEPEVLNEKLSQFLQDFNNLKAILDQLKKYKSLDELSEKISLVDYAKLNSALAYTLNSLYYMYMKLNGITFEDHKINQEIDRIQKYVQKIQEVVLLESERKRNPIRVDIEAAERHIRHHLTDNDQIRPKKKDDEEVMEVEADSSKGSSRLPLWTLQAGQFQEDNKTVKETTSNSISEVDEWATKLPNKSKKKQKLHKGSLLPSGAHLSWKDEIEKMLK